MNHSSGNTRINLILLVALIILAAGPASIGVAGEGQEYSVFAETMVDMNWLQVEEAAREGAVVLLPVGVIEEHGPHLPLGTDVYLPYLHCMLARRALVEKGIKAVIAPPFYWGINVTTGAYPGSFTVRPETMRAVLGETFACLKTWGFKRVFILNGHGDATHGRTLYESVAAANTAGGLDVAVVRALMVYQGAYASGPDYHAGTSETSLMAGHYPGLVNGELARTLPPETAFVPPDTRRGYVGEPAKFDAEAGRKTNEAYGKAVAGWIEDYLKAM